MRYFLIRVAAPAVAVVGVLAAGMATPARADLEILLSADGTNWTKVAHDASGTTASYSNNNFHGFNISVLSDDSNSPGTSTLAYLEGSDVHVKNNNAGVATLYIKLSDTGFHLPVNPAPVTLDSQIGGSITVGGSSNALSYQSYVDPMDREAWTGGFTAGAQKPNITGKTQKSYSNDSALLITHGLTSAYSITEYFKLTLAKGSQVGFQSSTNLSAPAPEPSGLVLAGMGALGLIGYALRRRRAAEAADAR
jgi:MYXO-CTERM domain-containing protein